MKFVFFGYDFMLPSVQALIESGHELIGVMSFECDEIFNFNHETAALAHNLGIPFILDKPAPPHIDNFIKAGAEFFLAAGYPYIIPDIPTEKAKAINFHPSYLPKGRGIMPTPHIIIDHPEAAGFTIHKMTSEFDKGAILYQEALPLNPRETVETYSARIAMRAPATLVNVINKLESFWQYATPQNEDEASYFPMPSEDMRHIDFNDSAKEIDKTARAFGRFGCMAQVNDILLAVFQCETWEEKHDIQPGAIACRTSRELTIACKDGFVCLKEFQEI